MADLVRLLCETIGVRPRLILPVLLLAIAAGLTWSLVSWKKQPPEIPFTKVIRETIVSSVTTNGKVEPFDWASARAERSGPVVSILTDRGKQVEQGAPLVELDSSDAQADLATAQARIAQAHADLAMFERGGRTTDLADISASIAKAKLDLDAAQRDFDVNTRLEAKGAATKSEVAAAKQRVDTARLQMESLAEKRKALVVSSDRSAALAYPQDQARGGGRLEGHPPPWGRRIIRRVPRPVRPPAGAPG